MVPELVSSDPEVVSMYWGASAGFWMQMAPQVLERPPTAQPFHSAGQIAMQRPKALWFPRQRPVSLEPEQRVLVAVLEDQMKDES